MHIYPSWCIYLSFPFRKALCLLQNQWQSVFLCYAWHNLWSRLELTSTFSGGGRRQKRSESTDNLRWGGGNWGSVTKWEITSGVKEKELHYCSWHVDVNVTHKGPLCYGILKLPWLSFTSQESSETWLQSEEGNQCHWHTTRKKTRFVVCVC